MTAHVAGPRQARRALQRQRRRRQLLAASFAAVVVCLVAIVAAAWSRTPPRSQAPAAVGTQARQAGVAEQDTLLLVRHGRGDGPARGVTLLASRPDGAEAVVLFVPVGTLVDIPGFGLDRLGLAYQYGGTALVEASVENLLGVDIDHAAGVSASGLSALLGRTGGLEVDITEQLVRRRRDGVAEVRFQPGTQFLDGERLVEYWTSRQSGESEIDTFPRQQLVWSRLLQAADGAIVEALVGDGAPQLATTADPAFLRGMVSRLAEAERADRVEYMVLPVSPLGAADSSGAATYRPTPDAIRQLTQGPLAGSVPAGGGTDAIRVQVLNGVGTPGIGQEIDRRLEGAGLRIVLTDNARSFDFQETRILLYREDDRSLEAARQVQRRLGVGTIQISRQPQSVVDLTIVVGADLQPGDAGEQADPDGDEPQADEEPSV